MAKELNFKGKSKNKKYSKSRYYY